MNQNNILMIATIGFYQHDRLEYAIARRPVAKIVMLHSPDERSKNAAKKIEEKYGKDMTECIEVDPWDYEGILTTALKIPEGHKKLRAEYHIGLGTRVMTMALAMAAMFTGSEMYMVIEDEEKTMRELREIKLLPFRPMQIQKRIFLEVLAKAEKKEPESEKGFDSKDEWRKKAKARLEKHHKDGRHQRIEIGRSNRHMNRLIEWGFAKVEESSVKHAVRITRMGQAVLQLKHTRRQLWSKPRS